MKKFVFLMCLCGGILIASPGDVTAFQDMNLDEVKALAAKGDPEAQTRLGVAYSKGINVKEDKNKAAEWYTKAAEQGYATGQWNLAFLYVRGEGVPQDDKKARELFQRAADQGFAPAEYDLGMMHLYGMGGKRSRTDALKWVRKAADQGYQEAIGFLRSQGEYDKKSEGKTPKVHTQ